jgi:osmotically-inducible protein OsmY
MVARNGELLVLHPNRRTIPIALSLVAALSAICCGCAPSRPSSNTGPNAAQGAKAPAKSDAEILADVKRVYAADPDLSKEKIQVEVKDGRVTLTGVVSDGAVRIRAEDKARSVQEVFGVDAERLIVR